MTFTAYKLCREHLGSYFPLGSCYLEHVSVVYLHLTATPQAPAEAAQTEVRQVENYPSIQLIHTSLW